MTVLLGEVGKFKMGSPGIFLLELKRSIKDIVIVTN
jgi:hypothetical protein